jgi:hypothetical protein
MARTIARSRLVYCLWLIFLACEGAGSGAGGLRISQDTIGDTIIVRTLAGSVWGEPRGLLADLKIGELEGADPYAFGDIRSLAVGPDGSIYVYDAQAKQLRKYASDGTFVAVFGREGGGPGEYRNPDGGLAATADGRVWLRDPGNGRINIYSPDGTYLNEARVRGSFSTSRRLYSDTAGNVYSSLSLNPVFDPVDRREALLRYDRAGSPRDTLAAPVYEEPPSLVARRENDGSHLSSSRPVPFSPSANWAYSPLGYFVGGLPTDYAIDLYRPEGVLRIGRAFESVTIDPREREDAERRATAIMRQIDPDWRWNGPAIPDTKPPYRSFFIGEDGRIWIQLHQRGVEREHGETEAHGGSVPEPRWYEPVAFDIFEADGRYLGQVAGPRGLSLYPTPVARGDTLWAVLRDDLDVPYIERYRITAIADVD